MDNVNNDWRTSAVRQNVVDRIAEAIQVSGVQQNANDMENQLFQKANSHEHYRQIVSRFLQVFHDRGNQKKQMDPINALQNLTNQGARNPMPTGQMMMGNNPNASALQNLIHQRAAQAGQQQMAGMQNMRANQGMPNAMGNVMPNVVGNVMQQGNAMPPGSMNANNMNINMGANIGQQVNAGGQVSNNMVGQIAQAMPMQGIRTNQAIGNAMPNAMPNANVMQQGNVMQAGPMNPNAMNMNQNNMNINMGNIAQQQANANAQIPNSMAGQMQTLPNIQGIRNAPAMPSTMGNAISNAGPIVMQQTNATPGTLNPNINMATNIGQQVNAAGPANNIVGQMNQMNPMMRNQNAPNAMFQGVRNTTPNQPFFRKSPSPSAPSPMGGNLPNQMIPSPALVQMVPSPQVANIMTQRNVMAQSPSNTNLNTPGQSGAAPSPLNPQEEHLYREKYRQLTKYIEPLKRMMARMGSDDEKLLKMNKLLEILCNPNQRIPLDTLMKCEVALEKMDLKSYSIASATSTFGSGKEHNVNTLLFEAISANLQSPIGNHTLQRTFRPCIETLFGSDIKNLPPAKAPRMSSDARPPDDVPIILQGEIARLDRKFQISFDTSNAIGAKVIKLICTLDDPFLPSIPPMYVSIPPDYPESSPKCTLLDHDFNATPFFVAIQKSFATRMFKTASVYSLSHVLDKLEMSVRQAYTTTFDQDTPTVPMLELGV